MHVRMCMHVRVCWGVAPHSTPPTPPPGKNGEHSVSPKPQDPPSRKSQVSNIWSWAPGHI